jgi:hypothetical protein
VDDPGLFVENPGSPTTEVEFLPERLEAPAQFLVPAGEESLDQVRGSRGFRAEE